MKRKEFIDACSKRGYCTKKQAEEYAKDREEFTETDLEEAYRYAERVTRFYSDAQRRSLGDGAKTTKRFTVYNSHKGGSA